MDARIQLWAHLRELNLVKHGNREDMEGSYILLPFGINKVIRSRSLLSLLSGQGRSIIGLK